MRLHSTEMVKERVLTKRKNRGDDTQQQFQEGTESGNDGGGWEEAVKAVASGRRLGGARKRFVGVRQRPSGRWVAEIKDTIQKIRLWLGTFDTAEEAARAYDEAACLLRGANTRTNFWPCSPNSNPDSKPPSALPSKVSRLLLLRLKARNSAMNQPQLQEHEVNNNTQFSEFINSPNSFDYDEFTTSPEYEPCSTVESTQFNQMNIDLDYDWSDVGQISGSDPNDGVLAEEVDRTIDLQFIDEGSVAMGDYSAFEIAEEIAEEEPLLEQESGGAIASSDEPSMLRAAMKRMKYERKISASLYAMNGISECLRLRLGGFVQELNQNKQADRVSEESSTQLVEPSSASSSSTTTTMSSENGVEISESLLWSSLDLSPICFVT